MSYRLKAQSTPWFESTLQHTHEKMIEYRLPSSLFFDFYVELYGVKLIVDNRGYITHLEFENEDEATMFLLKLPQ